MCRGSARHTCLIFTLCSPDTLLTALLKLLYSVGSLCVHHCVCVYVCILKSVCVSMCVCVTGSVWGYVCVSVCIMNVYMCVSFQWSNNSKRAVASCVPRVHLQGRTQRVVWGNGAREAGATVVMSGAQPRPVGRPRARRGRACAQSPPFGWVHGRTRGESGWA